MNTLKDYRPLFERAKTLMWAYLLIVFALKLFGFEVISNSIGNSELINFINSNVIVRVAVKTVFNLIGIHLICYCAINRYSKKIFVIISAIAFIYSILLNLAVEYNILVYLIPIISLSMYFVPLLFKISYKVCLKVIFIDILFQSISMLSKELSVLNVHQSFYVIILLALDYYIMWAIYALNKKVGEKQWHWQVLCFSFLKQRLKSLITKLKSYKNFIVKRKQTLRKIFTNLSLKTLKLNVKCYAKILLRVHLKTKIIPPIVFAVIYFSYAHWVDKVFESILLLIAYGTFRYLYPKKFHADYIPNIKAQWISFACVLLSCLTLCLALENTLITELSILSSLVVAFVVDWLLYVVREHFDAIKDKPLFEKLLKLFTPREQLKSKLTEKGFKDLHIRISILYVIDKMTMEQVSKEIGYSLQTCKNYWGEVTKEFPELKKNKKVNK